MWRRHRNKVLLRLIAGLSRINNDNFVRTGPVFSSSTFECFQSTLGSFFGPTFTLWVGVPSAYQTDLRGGKQKKKKKKKKTPEKIKIVRKKGGGGGRGRFGPPLDPPLNSLQKYVKHLTIHTFSGLLLVSSQMFLPWSTGTLADEPQSIAQTQPTAASTQMTSSTPTRGVLMGPRTARACSTLTPQRRYINNFQLILHWHARPKAVR